MGRPFPVLEEQANFVMHQSNSEYLSDILRGACQWSPAQVPNPLPNTLYSLEKQYWCSHLPSENSRHSENLVSLSKQEPNFLSHLLATLPRNYGWVLQYLSHYSNISPLHLHLEVGYLEEYLLALDPLFFGVPKFLVQQSNCRLGIK